MSDERMQEHIANWIKGLSLPSVIELREGRTVVEAWTANKESDLSLLASDILEEAGNNAFSEGKSKTYSLMSINERQERYECNLRIRKRVDKSAVELVQVLIKQNTELHETLRKKDKEGHDQLLALVDKLGDTCQTLIDENRKYREKSSEVIDKLENLRSKQLERDLAQKQVDAHIERDERLVDAAIPLAMAITSRMSKGMLPAPDLRQHALNQLVKSLSPSQMITLGQALGDEFITLFDDTLAGKPTINRFTELAGLLPQEKLMAASQILNMGQLAAIHEMINANGTH